MWEELEYYTSYCPSYTQDAIVYKKHVEEIQVFEFLTGLNLDYKQIRVQILNMAIPFTLNELYAYVHHEEDRRGVMNLAPSIDKSTLVSNLFRGGHSSFMGRSRSGKSTCLMIGITLNVSIVVGLDTPKISVRISMDAPMI